MNFPERTYKSMLIPLMQEDKRSGMIPIIMQCQSDYLVKNAKYETFVNEHLIHFL